MFSLACSFQLLAIYNIEKLDQKQKNAKGGTTFFQTLKIANNFIILAKKEKLIKSCHTDDKAVQT